jgi:putative hydrolase of the HAD superfamily
MKNLLDIKYWIFDLDNTLYSGQTKVFSEVDKKMSAFISKKMSVDLIKAKEIQKKYFYESGTTLSGLMKHDGIDPHEFLEFVHDIDISWLPKDLLLKEELIKIKEKKYIFTNGSHAHVENVTKQLGIDGLFDGVFDIIDANFIPKPHIDPYKKIMKKFDLDPKKSILIEDIAHNLEQAKNLGMKTCWLENDESFAKKDANKP